MTKIGQNSPDSQPIDPEPMAIVMVSIGTIAMTGTVANAFINYRKYVRDQDQRHEDAAADFLSNADALRAVGERLLHLIEIVGNAGDAAFKMARRPSRSETEGQARVLTLRAGETSIDLQPKERGSWKNLIATTARSVEMMDEACEAYEGALSEILSSGRRLEQLLGLASGLGPIIDNVVNESVKFRKVLDSYHNLRAGSSIDEVEQRFERVITSTQGMVIAANGFANLVRIIIMNRR